MAFPSLLHDLAILFSLLFPLLPQIFNLMPGDYTAGVTPLPIPNREVKPRRADGTASFRCGRVGRCQAFFYFFQYFP